jgi:hypothetical protein
MDVEAAVVVVVIHTLVNVDVEAAQGIDDRGGAFGLQCDDRVDRYAAEQLSNDLRGSMGTTNRVGCVNLCKTGSGDENPGVSWYRDQRRRPAGDVEACDDDRIGRRLIGLIT